MSRAGNAARSSVEGTGNRGPVVSRILRTLAVSRSSRGSGASARRLVVAVACLVAVGAAFFVIPAAAAVAATVNVTLTGAGAGTVTSSSGTPAIDCSLSGGVTTGTCSSAGIPNDFGFLAPTSMAATPAPGSVFSGWTVGVGGCVGTTTPCQFSTGAGGTFDFTASFIPTPDPPVAATDGSSAVGDSSATLHGRVNPNGFAVSGCRFEYGTTTDYGAAMPCEQSPASLGSDSADEPVVAVIEGLEPGVTYHYRLVATNLGGFSEGEDRTFATTGQSTCPNADIRLMQGIGTLLLPDCRAYELVSNGDSNGTFVTYLGGNTGDGNRVAFSAQSIGEPNGLSGPLGGPYVAQRSDTGWRVTPMQPDPHDNWSNLGGYNYSSDLSRVLWNKAPIDAYLRNQLTWKMAHLDESITAASPLLTPVDQGIPTNQYDFRGGSQDLSSFVFTRIQTRLRLEDPVLGSNRELPYMVTGADTTSPTLHLINQDTTGNPIGGICGAGLGGTENFAVASHAVSEDGSIVYFTARPGAPTTGSVCSGPIKNQFRRRIYKRIDNTSTIQVSASQCSRTPSCSTTAGDDIYQGASADGSKVFFTSPRQLTSSDTDTSNDLYVYDSSPPSGQPTLTQASAGEVTTSHPTIGSGAGVLGVAAAAADGSRVYFAATGALTATSNSEGKTAVSGQNNLYVFERDGSQPAGQVRFVATVSSVDASLWATSGTPLVHALPYGTTEPGQSAVGRYLVFVSTNPLTTDDTDVSEDLHRYDSTNGELLCLSCIGNGPFPVSIKANEGVNVSAPDNAQKNSIADASVSSVVFTTTESLSSRDTNGARDVYEWTGGHVYLISDGISEAGVTFDASMSADGDDIYFRTPSALGASDTDTSGDVYNARRNGGFLEPPSPPTPCSGEACQGPVAAAPLATPLPGPPGGGNADPGARKRLAVRRPGAKARRRAARRGVLVVRVRSSEAGRVAVIVRGRVGKRVRRLGRASKRLSEPGAARVRVRLNRVARKRLRSGRRLRVRVQVRSADARPKSVRVTLRRAGR